MRLDEILGECAKAKELLERAVDFAEKNYGVDHPSTAVSSSNLAMVLQDLGEYEKAKELLERAVASDEKNYGVDHSNTAVNYSNLALVLKALGEYTKAKEYSEKALQIFQNTLPEGHPYINTALVNYLFIQQQSNMNRRT